MTDFPRHPKIVGRGFGGSAHYDLYLDSSTGYEFQGSFDTREEAEEYVESLRKHPEHVPSLWD